MTIPRQTVPLGLAPDLVYAGIGRHGGDERSHFYRLADLWALHLYNYRGTLETHGRRFAIQKNSLSLVSPNVGFSHAWMAGDSVHVFFLFKLAGPSNEMGSIPVFQTLAPSAEARFEGAAALALRFMHEPARATAWLWEFLFAISSPCESSQSPIPPVVRRAMERIARGLNKKQSLNGVSKQVGLSHNQLTRLFQKHLGRSMVGYAADLRWERISRLLRFTEIPAKQIAYDFCFSDLSHFNKFVHQRCGLSPRQFRHAAMTPELGLASGVT